MLDGIIRGISEEEMRAFFATLDKITANMDFRTEP